MRRKEVVWRRNVYKGGRVANRESDITDDSEKIYSDSPDDSFGIVRETAMKPLRIVRETGVGPFGKRFSHTDV